MPPSGRRKRIEIVVAEGHAGLRTTLRATMLQEGYGTIKSTSALDAMVDAVRSSAPDLVIVDLSLGDAGSVTKHVRDLRHSQIGWNPFVPVIVTAWESGPEAVRAAVDAGVDDFLVKPLAARHLVDRVHLLSKGRRPFVVTSDYIGPDRRRDPGRGSAIDRIEVPNSLRDKELLDHWSADSHRRSVEECWQRVNLEKLRRDAFQICFLIMLLVEERPGAGSNAQSAAWLGRLADTATDAARRLDHGPPQGVQDFCVGILHICRSATFTGTGVTQKDRELLPLLGKGLLKALNPGRDEALLAREIAAAVAGFKSRQGGT